MYLGQEFLQLLSRMTQKTTGTTRDTWVTTREMVTVPVHSFFLTVSEVRVEETLTKFGPQFFSDSFRGKSCGNSYKIWYWQDVRVSEILIGRWTARKEYRNA